MDIRAFHAWLTALGEAWQRGDADATAALFAPGATYLPSSFGERIRGRDRIAAQWIERIGEQTAIRFEAEILGVGVTYGIAHWRVTLSRRDDPRTRVTDGILLAAFDTRGQATSVRGVVA